MQEDSTILENKEPKDDNAIDIKSLLVIYCNFLYFFKTTNVLNLLFM